MQVRRILAYGAVASALLVSAPAFAAKPTGTHHAPKLTTEDLNNQELARIDPAAAKQAPETTEADTSGNTVSDKTGRKIQTGTASWYGPRFNGHRAADGSRFDQTKLTAAHAWLPLGTRVRVTCPRTGRSVDVTITDRPGTRRRIIDLSKRAAHDLGIVGDGVARVTISKL